MKQNFLFLVFFVLIILTAGILSATNVENVGDWWGKVTINGNSGNNGAVVDAYINGNKVASATVGEYETDYYLIHIEGQSGNEIIFNVNGTEAGTVGWTNGDHELDLSVTIQEFQENNPPSSNGNSGGGGSSSSGSSSNPSSSNSPSTSGTSETSSSPINLAERDRTVSGITGAFIGSKNNSGNKVILILVIIVLGVAAIKYKIHKPLGKWTKRFSR